MSVVRKFIINRNDFKYIYAEEHFIEDGIYEYHVFDENGLHIQNMDYFNWLYGSDKKITLEYFLSYVLTEMRTTYINDANIPSIYESAYEIHKKIEGKNISNPSMWGYSHTLLDLLNKYNDFHIKKIASAKKFLEDINYEDEYQRIKQEL